MVRTQVQLSEAQMKALRQISSATGQSIADLVRQGVDRFLTAQSSVSRQERIDRAMRIAGKFSSGKSDVSAHHDDYLAQAFHDRLR